VESNRSPISRRISSILEVGVVEVVKEAVADAVVFAAETLIIN